MEVIKRKITEIVVPLAESRGLEIVDVEIAGNMRKPILRIYADKENGVTLEECEKLSRELSAVMDAEDLIQTAYVLEVSSPGLDRPLRGSRDFVRNIGKLVRVTTLESIENQNFFLGRIREVSDNSVMLEIDEKSVLIPLDQISKARLEIEFK